MGPLLTGACRIDPMFYDQLQHDLVTLKVPLRDSKTLSHDQRERLYTYLTTQSPHITWGIGVVTASEIDDMGLGASLRMCAKRAFDHLVQSHPQSAFHVILMDGIRDPKLGHPTQLIKKGDAQSLSIAAAAIVAKVTRDRMMQELHVRYPHYGWQTNIGYGTKAHQEGLSHFGVSPEHRTSYAPIKRLMQSVAKPGAVINGPTLLNEHKGRTL